MSTWAAELSRAADANSGAPAGVVRVTAPPGVAAAVVAPFAGWLKTRLPGIRLQVLSSVDYLDLARGQADLAIRMRPKGAKHEARRDLVVVHSVDVPIAAWGSADYVASLPTSPSLADIAWVAWAPPYEHLAPSSVLKAVIPNFTPAFAADDFLVQIAAAEAGVGAVVLGDFGGAGGSAFVSHRLQKVPLDLSGYGRSTVSLVAAKSAMSIGRVRAVADALVELMQGTSLRAPPRR
jgi:DNA-binding transcriptional LysR family regulator